MSGTGHWAVIPAAGAGRRMRSRTPKQYLPLLGRAVIEHTLARFIQHPRIYGIVVAIDADDDRWSSLKLNSAKPLITVPGGVERCHSVLNALAHLTTRAEPQTWVLVHDAVRACLAPEDLDRMIETLDDDPVGGILATRVRDTLKREDADGCIEQTVDRKGIWHALTPQMFRLRILEIALRRAIDEGTAPTDEAAAVERTGLRPRLVEGRSDNIKITYPEDLAQAETILAAQAP
jgi:2-C-methyl-D-erythritol 4-phosphate cytidylyltransferase